MRKAPIRKTRGRPGNGVGVAVDIRFQVGSNGIHASVVHTHSVPNQQDFAAKCGKVPAVQPIQATRDPMNGKATATFDSVAGSRGGSTSHEVERELLSQIGKSEQCRLTRWKLAAMLTALWAGLVSHARSESAQVGYLGAEKTLVPSRGWSCGMAEGIPVPERGVQVFQAKMNLKQVYDVGRTPFGYRKVFAIEGGNVSGEKLNAEVMSGGLDFELSFTNGAMEVEQILVLKTSDGKFIYVRNAGTAADQQDVRIVPDFEAPTASDHAWLNAGKYAGRRVVDLTTKTIKLTVFDVSNVKANGFAAGSVQVSKPPDVLDQPWDPRKAIPGEKRGSQLISENVTLSPSQSVGATKNGGRNIIPITGGTLSGKINGKILTGGADYQKLGNPVTLDARYLWQTDEGDVIIVRNAGPIASLAPTFEVRLDSKHAWLNTGTYLSSGPGMGAGGVKLVFYESTQ